MALTKSLGGSGVGGGGAAEPTIVQTAVLSSNGSVGQVTFAAAPTAGNLLVAIAGRFAGSIATSAGWTRLYDQGNAGSDVAVIFYKVAAASESTTQQFSSSSTGWAAAVFEISGAAPGTILAYAAQQSLASASSVTANVGIAKAACLGIGMFSSQGRTPPTLTITGATASTSATDGSGRACKACFSTGLTKSAWQPSCTYSTSGTNGYGVVILGGV